MKQLPSRFRRLDGALADLPVEEPMLLTELDGFLTGLLVSPETIPTDEWMTVIWGAETDGVPPFEDPLDVQWFLKAVAARQDEIGRDLSRGKMQPIIDVDKRGGEILWEYWIDGFAEAMAMRPDSWAMLTGEPGPAEPWSRLMTLIAIARDESDLDSAVINAFQDRAVTELKDIVQRLYDAHQPAGEVTAIAVPATMSPNIGRNAPCYCGPGKKHKNCCS